MPQSCDKHVLDNGMVILGEPMDAVESVAFDFILPAGAAVLPEGCCGAANVISDWVFRGAGDRDSRGLGDALDGLGLHRAGSVGTALVTLGATMEASNLAAAVDLYADVVLRPHLSGEEFVPARQLAIEGVRALDDDPRQRVMIELRKQSYPHPWGRSTAGDIAELESLTPETVKHIVQERFDASRTIFTIAGKYDFGAVCAQIGSLFGAGECHDGQEIACGERPGRYRHIENDGAQVHIGLMTDTVTLGDEDYYNARVAISVLSGGMSARLFTEVREKRGLCYAVGARYHALREYAGILCYAGTTADKAQETLDVIVSEFRRLKEGISEEELARAKVGLKSALILQSESSSSRAGGIGSDYYLLGRVRGLDEIAERVEATSVDSVIGFLERAPFEQFTVVTIGPKQVKVE